MSTIMTAYRSKLGELQEEIKKYTKFSEEGRRSIEGVKEENQITFDKHAQRLRDGKELDDRFEVVLGDLEKATKEFSLQESFIDECERRTRQLKQMGAEVDSGRCEEMQRRLDTVEGELRKIKAERAGKKENVVEKEKILETLEGRISSNDDRVKELALWVGKRTREVNGIKHRLTVVNGATANDEALSLLRGRVLEMEERAMLARGEEERLDKIVDRLTDALEAQSSANKAIEHEIEYIIADIDSVL